MASICNGFFGLGFGLVLRLGLGLGLRLGCDFGLGLGRELILVDVKLT